MIHGDPPETMHSPAHGQVCANVLEALFGWSPRHSKGLLLSNQPPVLFRNVDPGHALRIECRPDITFIERGRIRAGELKGSHLPVPPDLAVEVYEPGDRWEDVERMVEDCLEAGVREFWVLRLRERDLRVFRGTGGSLTLSGNAQVGSDVLPGFRCKVADFFAGL